MGYETRHPCGVERRDSGPLNETGSHAQPVLFGVFYRALRQFANESSDSWHSSARRFAMRPVQDAV